jgi:hypothetical protein
MSGTSKPDKKLREHIKNLGNILSKCNIRTSTVFTSKQGTKRGHQYNHKGQTTSVVIVDKQGSYQKQAKQWR